MATVPRWLKLEVGKGKSFNDIRRIDGAYLCRPHRGEDAPRDDKKREDPAAHENPLNLFPDIEFLPKLHPSVLEDARQRTSQKKRGNRTGAKHTNGHADEDRKNILSEEGEEVVLNIKGSGLGARRKGATRVSKGGGH